MQLRSYSGKVYRNFATIIESQDLTDDLSEDLAHREILKSHFYDRDAEQKAPVERILDKSESQISQEEIDKRFRPENWWASRYSDGSWAVLYAAENEETALFEALYHQMVFYREELALGPVQIQRRVLSLQIESERMVDLLLEKGLNQNLLISNDDSGYPYCQGLALRALSRKAQLLRAPSARRRGGVCTPVFDRSAIAKDEGHLKYLRCTLRGDGKAEVSTVIEGATKVYDIP